MPNHRGVPAAEKYAELLANGQERPLCACHGKTMEWKKNPAKGAGAGGCWVCSQKRIGPNNRYRAANLEHARASTRRWNRAKRGLPEDHPVMTRQEMGRHSGRIRRLRKAVTDQAAMNIIERMDFRQAQLMRLAVNEGASPYERRRALEKLDQHLATKLKGSDPAWQHSKITSEGTRTPQPLPRSTYC